MQVLAQAFAVAAVVWLTSGCAGRTSGAQPDGAPPSDGSTVTDAGPEDGTPSLASLPSPKFMLGSQATTSFCAAHLVVDATGRSWTTDGACEGDAKVTPGVRLQPSELAQIEAAFSSLPAEGCPRESLKSTMRIYFFEWTKSETESTFWWGCDDADGNLLPPYRDVRDLLLRLTAPK